MAWAISQKDFGSANASSTAWTNPTAFTPTANCLLLLLCVRSVDGSISGITGHDGGGSWVQIFTAGTFTGWTNRAIEVWGCFTGATPSEGQVVVSKTGYTWNFSCNLIEVHENVNGVDISGAVAAAFGTPQIEVGYDVTPYALTLGAFANAGNLTLVWGFSNGAPTWTWDATGYTALTANTATLRIQATYLAAEDNSVAVTSARYIQAGIHGFEIKQGVAAGGLSIPVAMAHYNQTRRN